MDFYFIATSLIKIVALLAVVLGIMNYTVYAERRISALDSREDEVYRKWRNEYHELRYRAPNATRLFQVAFRIAAPNPETAC